MKTDISNFRGVLKLYCIRLKYSGQVLDHLFRERIVRKSYLALSRGSRTGNLSKFEVMNFQSKSTVNCIERFRVKNHNET